MREMKDSGVAWIGRIPATWRTLTIGSLFKVRNEKVNDTDYLPLSVTKGGIVPQMENVAKSDATDNRKKVLSGDFVINSRSDRKQSCGVSLIDGSVSLINTVLYPAKGAPIIQTYLNYLLKNYGFAEEFYRWGHGIVADLWTTRWQEMKSILIPVPPMDEQRKILNAASAQIDSLIEIIQTQIERLNDYRTSVISSHTSDTSFRHLKLKRVVNNVEQGWSPSPTERKDGGDWQVLTLAAVKFILSRINERLTNDFFDITLVGSEGLAVSGRGNNAWNAYVASLNIMNAKILFSKSNLFVSKLFEPGTDGNRKSLEKHHLFPKAYLKSLNCTDAKINQMANYALIDWKDNMDILDDAPSVYYPIICAGMSDEQIRVMEEENALPHGWENMSYDDFLIERRKLMAAKIKIAFEVLKKAVTE